MSYIRMAQSKRVEMVDNGRASSKTSGMNMRDDDDTMLKFRKLLVHHQLLALSFFLFVCLSTHFYHICT